MSNLTQEQKVGILDSVKKVLKKHDFSLELKTQILDTVAEALNRGDNSSTGGLYEELELGTDKAFNEAFADLGEAQGLDR